MSTTVAGILEDMSTGSPEMMDLPEQASCSRVVRFHNECVLIPKPNTRSKMPVVLTKSYALPLWKKKTSNDSDVEDAAPPQGPEDKRVTIKVPIPTFRRRLSHSPTRRIGSIPSSNTPSSLPSCLVYRANADLLSSNVKPVPIRRPSLPIYHPRQDELTVPLRDCCADCQRITEECLQKGNDWTEQFSRGARRRRSASLNSSPPPIDTRNANPNRAFTPFSSEGSASKDLNSKFGTAATAFSITVDEVDRRRKSFDLSLEDTDFIRALSPPSPSPSSSPTLFHSSASPFASSSGSSVYPRVKSRDRETSSSSTVSSISTTDESLLSGNDSLDSRSRLRASPIEEEDETQLFPLPGRSRSITPSPSSSPIGSRPPSPMPDESSSPLSAPCPHISSKRSSSPSRESILCNSLSRIAPAPSVSTAKSRAISATSALPSRSSSLPVTTESAAGERSLQIAEDPRASKTESSDTASAVQPVSPPVNTCNEISDQNDTPPLLAPSSSNSSSTDNINNSSLKSPKPETLAKQVNSNINSKPPSAFANHSSSSLVAKRPSQQKRRLSFTMPFIKAGGAIRDAGVDVLRGVSSMSISTGVGSVGSF